MANEPDTPSLTDNPASAKHRWVRLGYATLGKPLNSIHLSPSDIHAAVERICASPEWAQSPRMGQFLRFVTGQTLEGRGAEIKETVVGVHVFGREAGYDPKLDPVVRVEARRLRAKLLEYYAGSGSTDPVRVELPKGTYQPSFSILEAAQPQPSGPAPTVSSTITSNPSEPRMWRWVAAALAALAFGAAGWTLRPRPTAASTPKLLTDRQGLSRSPSFSPDGQSLAYAHEDSGRYNIRILPLGGSSRPFTAGTEIDYEPRWSPDGKTIAFLRRVSEERFTVILKPATADASSKGERSLTTITMRGTFDWMPDGSGLLFSDRADPSSPLSIFLVDVAEGRRRQITAPPPGSPGDGTPRASPDGREVAFVRAAESAVHDVWSAPITGGPPRRLTNFKGRVEGVVWHPREPSILASLQPPGELRSLWRVPLDGSPPFRVPEAGVGPIQVAISPKGDRLAWVDRFADTNVWSTPLPYREGSARAITAGLALDTGPQVSPDGAKIAWRSARTGRDEVWICDAGGSNPRRITHMNGPTTGSAHWSPDGSTLVFDSRPNGNGDIFMIPADGGTPKQLTKDTSNEVLPSYSRDGRWIYFSTDRNGGWEVWKMRPDGLEPARVVGNGAFAPTESHDGEWLFFTKQSEGGVWRVPAAGGEEEKLTTAPAGNQWGQWSVTPAAIYLLSYAPPTKRHILRFDLKSRKTSEVMPVSRFPVHFDSAMSAAASEAFLTWAQLDSAGSEIMMIDGFR